MQAKLTRTVAGFAAAMLVGLAAARPAAADDVKLPANLSWTAYGTTSSGYAQSIGLGNMLKKRYGTELRIIPGKNDVSRMLPLKAGQVEICACGIAAYFAQEGVLLFANKNWGPVKQFNLFNNIGRNGIALGVAGDAGVKTVQDLKGKRVAWVKGAPALNVNATAVLAFGGLSWNEVVKVEVPGWGQSMQGILDGQIDAAASSTIASIYSQISASPRGLWHLSFPHDDAEGWARLHSVAPYWNKIVVTSAVDIKKNITGETAYEGGGYAYPSFISTPTLSDEIAYGLTKAVMANYEDYAAAGPGMDGYLLENQTMQWVFPYHPGAIAYFKEQDAWTAEDQAYTDELLRRQDVLADAWESFIDKGAASDATFETEWLEHRAAALEKAGMSVPFRKPLS